MIRGISNWTRSLVALAPFILACSGAQPKEGEVPTGDPAEGGGTDTSETSGGGTSSSKPPPPVEGSGGLSDTQKEQMEVVLKRGARKAENCSQSVPDGKGGEGEVKVLFDGQKGKVTEVTVGAPWAGTSMESCVKRAFVDEYIVPFDGDPLEVPYTVKIPEKAGAAAADPKKPGKKP